MNFKLIKPYGFCKGVINSFAVSEKALIENPKDKIYILGDLIHNATENDKLRKKGYIFISYEDLQKENIIDLDNINSTIILSAHGTKKDTFEMLKSSKIKVYDATCPIVNKINDFIKNQKNEIIYIGVKNHTEQIASFSYASSPIYLYDIYNNDFDYSKIEGENPVVINQSTIPLSIVLEAFNSIKKHFNKAQLKTFECPFVNERITNLLNEINEDNLVLICGSKTSNNTKMLLDICQKYTNTNNCYLICNLKDLNEINFKNNKKIVVASGTSTTNSFVEDVCSYIEKL